MRLRADQPPSERGIHAGRPWWLWEPLAAAHPPPWPAIVILHGAGSAKESHADFGRVCAGHGWVALAYDQRGHGESEDAMDGGALDDVAVMARLLAEREHVDGSRICVRGSSMGGCLAIHAAAEFAEIAGVIAICPAAERGLREGLREGRYEMRAARAEFDAWLSERDISAAVTRIAPKPLILLHARGDDRVPVELTEELARSVGESCTLIVVPGGDHRSVQHDRELQATSLSRLAAILRRRGNSGGSQGPRTSGAVNDRKG